MANEAIISLSTAGIVLAWQRTAVSTCSRLTDSTSESCQLHPR